MRKNPLLRPDRVALASLLGLLGCQGCDPCADPTDPNCVAPITLTLSVAAGADQQAPVGGAVPIAPTVVVTTSDPNAQTSLAGLQIAFQANEGGGVIGNGVTDLVVETSGNGTATVVWRLGSAPGRNLLFATIRGGYDRIRYDVSGNGQVAFLATAVATPGEMLANRSFEQGVTAGLLPDAAGFWRGDVAESTLPPAGFAAQDGNRILRFVATGSASSTSTLASQQWQIIDVTGFASQIDQGTLRADAEVFFNRVAGSSVDRLFALDIMAFSGVPSEFPAKFVAGGWLAHRTAELVSDDLPATWERVSASLSLPPFTRYVVVQVYAFEDVVNDGVGAVEFAGHYADGASLKLVPQ